MASAPNASLFPAVSRRSMALGAVAVLIGTIVLAASRLWDPPAIRASFDVGGRSLYLEPSVE